MMTREVLATIKSTDDYKEACRIAYSACKTWCDETTIKANQLDNGWGMTRLYRMHDGGEIICDGRGWSARIPEEPA